MSEPELPLLLPGFEPVRKIPRGGYAAPPGTGPKGETCGGCKHIAGERYKKCRVVRARWTHGPATDIRSRAPACSKWEKATT